MLKIFINNPSKMCKTGIFALMGILGAVLVVQLLLPVSVDNSFFDTSVDTDLVNRVTIQGDDTSNNSRSLRTGLFKSAVAMKGKPLADKTIERIKSQLKLQCVMNMNGQLVAYIHIKGTGLKKCAVGDSVNDMFTVLNIDKSKKCVEISIIDHKVTLYM